MQWIYLQAQTINSKMKHNQLYKPYYTFPYSDPVYQQFWDIGTAHLGHYMLTSYISHF